MHLGDYSNLQICYEIIAWETLSYNFYDLNKNLLSSVRHAIKKSSLKFYLTYPFVTFTAYFSME